MEPLVSSAVEAYCTAHSTAASPLLTEVEDYTTRNCADAQMVIGPLQAAFLQLLIRTSGARRVLEIGTFTGYSAIAMAEALPEDGSVITCERDPQHADIAARFFTRGPHGAKISLRRGPALETLARLPAVPPLDFVFLDADKENYVNYYEQALPRLKTGGLVLADNVLWSARVLNPQRESDHALAQFNDHVRRDARVECVMVPLRDGLSLIRKR